MQLSSVLLVALTACTVYAQTESSSTKAGQTTATDAGTKATGKASNSTVSGKASASGKASSTSATKASATDKTNSSSSTSTGGTVKATTAGAPALLSQSGGLVTVAGLGIVFAVFM